MISYSSTIDHSDEELIACRCFLCVDFSVSSGYSCCVDLDTIENYLILKTVVLTYIYGINFTIPARVAAVAPRWASGLPMLWPS